MKAAEIMRALSSENVPFDIAYCSLDMTAGKSFGLKKETNIILQKGYRRNQSDKSEVLVSFLRLDSGERRQFYLPLLMELNGVKIRP